MRWLVLALFAVACANVPDASLFGLAADATTTPSDVALDAAGGNSDGADLGIAEVAVGDDADSAAQFDGDAAEPDEDSSSEDADSAAEADVDTAGATDGDVASCLCGDDLCSVACGENYAACPADCLKATCGDGTCEAGENPNNCPEDCCGFCGDGKCVGYICAEADPKSPSFCPADCATACGNGSCDLGENATNCSADCSPTSSCGNTLCDKNEDFASCALDCGFCGDGVCAQGLGETEPGCPADCKATCAADGDCNDNNACTVDTCSGGGTCKHTGTCDDNNLCTYNKCVLGVCSFLGIAATCADDVACTVDLCDPKAGCVHLGNDVTCTDSNPCTDDVCDGKQGCVMVPNSVTCTDSDVCTENDFCQGGACVAGAMKNCDDKNPCTIDSCEMSKGCTHTADDGAPCEDENLCTIGDVCGDGMCSEGKEKNCTAPGACYTAACDPVSGKCVTDYVTANLPCDDGNACSVKDGCDQGKCKGTAVVCDDNNLCTDDSCDAVTGCVYAANTAPCEDGDKCTLLDVCVEKLCKSGAIKSCEDGQVCTADSCDAVSGNCVYASLPKDGTPCDADTSVCTQNDACSDGKCLAGTGVDCDDKNPCTNDSCDAMAGCAHGANSQPCDDGNACTTGDACSAGVCKGTAPVCGNGVCDCGESNASCVADCATAATPQMALIPAGTFWMGCNSAKDPNCAANEKPQHKVKLSAYYMDVTETTVAQYNACVDAGICSAPSSAANAGLPNNPVNYLTWTQSRQYCQWRGAGFDLPTEAQWEMAARGSCEKNGSTAGDDGCAVAMRTYPWGEAPATCTYAVMMDTVGGCGSGVTWAVGSLPAGDSPYGLHDMAGNVNEWNRDWFGAYFPYAVTDPVGPGTASYRVIRGGAYGNVAAFMRADYRNDNTPALNAYDIGLRCSRPLDLCTGVTCPNLACATNTCDPASGQCVATPKSNTTPCNDGSACTTGDVCTSGTCTGTANCDDGNACTNDSCVNLACQHVNNTASCGDGNACTTGAACSAGVCKGAPVCGNGVCDCGESNASCVADCATAATPQMALIPAGTFWMGCNWTKETSCNSNEEPQHKVTLSAYYMDLTETTVTQYKACVDAAVCTAPSTGWYATYPSLPNNPVNHVTWTQSQAYCKWRGSAFDLPTEAQWEMAAKGSCEKNGSTAGDAGCAAAMRTYPWGEATATCSYAVMSNGTYGCGTNATWAVGSIPAGDSPYGLHDMAGNVWEWNRDWYSSTYYGSSPATDPYDSASAYGRVYRGGGFLDAVYLRAGVRDALDTSGATYDLGLRCVRSYP